jgi:hypothetical protein
LEEIRRGWFIAFIGVFFWFAEARGIAQDVYRQKCAALGITELRSTSASYKMEFFASQHHFDPTVTHAYSVVQDHGRRFYKTDNAAWSVAFFEHRTCECACLLY